MTSAIGNVGSLRRGKFLAGAALTTLAGCSGQSFITSSRPGGSSISAFECKPPCYPPPNYVATGGVNPSAWPHFEQYGSISVGWTPGTSFASGANESPTSLYYTGRTTTTASSLTHNLTIAGVGSLSATASFGNPSGDSIPYSGGTITNTNSTTLTATVTAQGTPCLVTLTTPDGTFQNFTLTYENLSTGAIWSTSYSLPSAVADILGSRHTLTEPHFHDEFAMCCRCLEVLVFFLGGVAVVLSVVALPEELAGAAYVVAVGRTVAGLNYGAVAAGLGHLISC